MDFSCEMFEVTCDVCHMQRRAAGCAGAGRRRARRCARSATCRAPRAPRSSSCSRARSTGSSLSYNMVSFTVQLLRYGNSNNSVNSFLVDHFVLRLAIFNMHEIKVINKFINEPIQIIQELGFRLSFFRLPTEWSIKSKWRPQVICVHSYEQQSPERAVNSKSLDDECYTKLQKVHSLYNNKNVIAFSSWFYKPVNARFLCIRNDSFYLRIVVFSTRC